MDCDLRAGRREARHANRQEVYRLAIGFGAVAAGDFFPRRVVAPIILFRQPRTIEKLVGHALKSGKHYDDRSPPRFLKNDPGDTPDAIGCGKRRTTKLKDFHRPEPM